MHTHLRGRRFGMCRDAKVVKVSKGDKGDKKDYTPIILSGIALGLAAVFGITTIRVRVFGMHLRLVGMVPC